jgi:hypothetical protein
MIIIASKEEKELLQRLRKLESFSKTDEVPALTADVISLKKQVTNLEIEKSKKQEEFDKEERELRHMIGLEKKRQEFEITQAKRETTVVVREENLAADKKRFEEQMQFHDKRFTAEVGYLKDMLKDILGRLPNVNMSIKRGGK